VIQGNAAWVMLGELLGVEDGVHISSIPKGPIPRRQSAG
jgi:hypothetical protein